MKTHNIAISVESVGLRKRVDVVEGDSGRKIRCKMEDMTIPTDSVARIYAEKPSGLKVYNDCTISDGYVVAELTTQMTAEVGSTQCQIEITSGDENVTSFEFELKVHKKLKDSGSIESTNEFTALEEALKKAESYANGNVPETDIAAAVAAYLEANPPSVDTDTTLTVGGKAADAKATGEAIDKKITTPSTASVGQVLVVTAVDEDGKPSAWETIDQEDGSAERIEATEADVELQPNKLYVFGEMETLNLTLADPDDTAIVNEYHAIFTSGETATTLTIPDTVKTPSDFTIEASKVYELSILDGYLMYQSW